MIPRAQITAWRSKVPWTSDAQVEQDLVVSRALVDLFSDKAIAREMAFRGGTALNKLYFATPSRYSEDIDLVQVTSGAIGGVMDAIRKQLDPWLGTARWNQGEGRVTITYRFDSEIKPITPLRLKVEINTREHFFVFDPRRIRVEVDNPWYRGSAEVLTYEPEELLGTKLRALYQRKKGRDLFDLSEGLKQLAPINPHKVVTSFTRYLAEEQKRVTRAEFEKNLREKLRDPAFLGDVPPLLASGVSFDPQAAFDRVQSDLIALLPEGAAQRKRRRSP